MTDDDLKPIRTQQLKKWYKRALIWGPLFGTFIGALATGAMWLDTRYMHKEISDNRHIDTQILVLDMRIEMYSKIIDSGRDLTATEETKYDFYQEQRKFIMAERQKLMGIGGTP